MACQAIFDSIALRIIEEAERASGEDLLLRILIEYILLFRDIALNKGTQAVYYDLVQYSGYDAANIERLKRTSFRYAKRLAAAYGGKLSDERLTAMIVTSDSFAKALFKGIMNGLLDLSLEEAMDYFCRRILLPDIPVPEREYRRTLRKAFKIGKEL